MFFLFFFLSWLLVVVFLVNDRAHVHSQNSIHTSHAHTTSTDPAIYTTSTYTPGSSFPSSPVTKGTAFDLVCGATLTLCCLSRECLCERPRRTSGASDRGITRNTSQMLDSRMAMCSRYSHITLEQIW